MLDVIHHVGQADKNPPCCVSRGMILVQAEIPQRAADQVNHFYDYYTLSGYDVPHGSFATGLRSMDFTSQEILSKLPVRGGKPARIKYRFLPVPSIFSYWFPEEE